MRIEEEARRRTGRGGGLSEGPSEKNGDNCALEILAN